MFKLATSKLLEVDELKQTGESTLIDKLLADQKKLTAVERFSQKHENVEDPLLKPHYEDLIPIKKPSTGEQYAFSVDLDKCTGCKSCVVACHSRNGLDEDESWRDVGVIHSDSTNELQTVTSACHHCADPACLSGCPVGAYEKMPDTGIVRHLDDQCIGCQYCSLKCPYDVPKYSKRLGIVRKCDMCHDRLSEGEAPACVQACPTGAIKIELVSTETIEQRAQSGGQVIAGAYRSDYTKPATRYHSKSERSSDMVAADRESLEASHKHTPLSLMLMFTQVSVGLSLAEFTGRLISAEWMDGLSIPILVTAAVLGMIGLLASVFHLGSPLGAWRVFLGLRTSWLSREVVMFGIWMPMLQGYIALQLLQKYHSNLPEWIPMIDDLLLIASGCLAVGLGLLSVYCSVMVYVDTKRAFWAFPKTCTRFFGSLLVGGATGILLTSLVIYGEAPVMVWGISLATWLMKSLVELSSLKPAWKSEWSTGKKSALIQWRTLRGTLIARWFMLGLSLLLVTLSTSGAIVAITAFSCLIWGEYLARQMFFQAVETLKMPGN